MKKIGEHIIRGKIDSDNTGTTRMQLFDGRFDTGYKVTGVAIAPGGWATDSADCFLILSTIEDSAMNAFNPDWSVNTQIAWAGISTLTSEELTGSMYNVVDPENMVIEDLYIAVRGDVGTNYMIFLEKYEFPDWQGASTMVRNNP